MKDRPIMFSAPMVHAILEGRKTQTRRAVRKRDVGVPDHAQAMGYREGFWEYGDMDGWHKCEPRPCPYGATGDRYWVRENGWEPKTPTLRELRDGADTWPKYAYDADVLSEQDIEDFKTWGWKRRPSIYMPRWASRITLEVVAVRVERLLEIVHSPQDLLAEGIEARAEPAPRPSYLYRVLWEKLNGKGSWDVNPWVWVIEFKRAP